MHRPATTGAEVDAKIEPTIGSARWIYRTTVLLAITPLVVAAIRNGLHAWQPTWDAAIMTVRVRDVFSGHVPLIGMAASPGGEGQTLYSQPGPLEFFALAVPVKLFGTTWGLLLGIAGSNSAAIVAALWLIRRRAGELAAIAAAGFVASLLWSLGSEVMLDVNPGQVGILLFFTFLVAAWSVLDGDRPAIVVLAIVGNFLFLTHLRFVFVVPAVAIVTVASWIFLQTRARHANPDSEFPAVRRYVIGGLVVTALAWAAPLWDQIAGSGNLGKLLGSATGGGASSAGGTLVGAFGAVLSVTAVPPFWLPPTFSQPPFDVAGGGQPLLLRAVCALVLLAWFVAVAIWAYRGRNRMLLTGLAVAGTAWWAMVATWVLNPSANKLPVKYFWELWPLAAFLWFVILLASVRAIPWPTAVPRLRRVGIASVGCGLVLIASALALPRHNNCGGRCSSMRDELMPVMRSVRSEVAHTDLGDGPILVDSPLNWSRQLLPAIIFALQDKGIPFRVRPGIDVQQYGEDRDGSIHADATHELYITNSPEVPEHARQLGVFETEPFLSPGRYRLLDARMERWITRPGWSLDDLQEQLSSGTHGALYDFLVATFAHEMHQERHLMPFAKLVTDLDRTGLLPSGGLIDIPDMSASDVRSWALETIRRESGTYYLYEVSPP